MKKCILSILAILLSAVACFSEAQATSATVLSVENKTITTPDSEALRPFFRNQEIGTSEFDVSLRILHPEFDGTPLILNLYAGMCDSNDPFLDSTLKSSVRAASSDNAEKTSATITDKNFITDAPAKLRSSSIGTEGVKFSWKNSQREVLKEELVRLKSTNDSLPYFMCPVWKSEDIVLNSDYAAETISWNGLTYLGKSLSRLNVDLYIPDETGWPYSTKHIDFLKPFAPALLDYDSSNNKFYALNTYKVLDAAIFYIKESSETSTNYTCANYADYFIAQYTPDLAQVGAQACGALLASAHNLPGSEPYSIENNNTMEYSLYEEDLEVGQWYTRFIIWRSPYQKANSPSAADVFAVATPVQKTATGIKNPKADAMKISYYNDSGEMVVEGCDGGVCIIRDALGRQIDVVKISGDRFSHYADKAKGVFFMDVQANGTRKVEKGIAK